MHLSIHLLEKKTTMLDQTDLQLLRLIQQDARLTTKELAAELNLTTTPVFERLKRLKNDGYIRKEVVLLDGKKLGIGLQVFCEVSLKEHKHDFLMNFEAEITKIAEILECHHITGNFDYLLKIVVRDMDGYQFFLKEKLARLDNISRVESHFVMTEVKNSTELPI